MPAELTARQARTVEAAPEMSKGVLTKAYLATCSPRAAIKAKCLDCCAFNRDEIRNCRAEICPIWNFRPFQAKS